MADSTPASKKKGKKPGNGQKAGLALGGAVLVYVLYRWYQNRNATTATTTAATDPLTGQPYAAGVGSLAPGASTSSTTTPDPTIDPSTGQTWASELTAANTAGQTSGGTDPTTGQSYASEVSALSTWEQDLAAGINPVTNQPFPTSASIGTGSGTNTDTAALAAWRANAVAGLQLSGLSPAAAAQQVSLYLESKPLTSIAAAAGLTGIANNNPAPIASGSLPLPTISKATSQAAVVVTNPGGGNDAAAVAALAKAQAAAAKAKGTPAAAQANKNLAGAQKAVTARNVAAAK